MKAPEGIDNILFSPVIAGKLSWSEVNEMDFFDLMCFHELETYYADVRAEHEMKNWQKMPIKQRGSAPYRRA